MDNGIAAGPAVNWIDEYVADIHTQLEPILDAAERSYGIRPTVEITAMPMVDVRPVIIIGEERYPVGSTKIPLDQTTARRKPKLMARMIGRYILWANRRYGSTEVPNLWSRRHYIEAKRDQRTYHYHNHTALDLEVPPTPLERLLHPRISSQVTRLQASTQDLPHPPVYVYQPYTPRIPVPRRIVEDLPDVDF